jgi:predicted Zn-dependent protease
MKYKKILSITLSSVLLAGCTSVPISGRRQLNMLPESDMMATSLTSYRDFLNKNTVESANTADAQLVQKVGNKIARAVEQYFTQTNNKSRIEGYNWEFNTVKDKTVNAWCMPGGKVVVYTGLLSVTQDETSLAVVLGHEIAHAVARHGNERMSQQLLTQAGGVALSVALSNKSAETQNMFMAAYGVGSTVGIILPYSRAHESEADKLGLVFMAMAGYNPQQAISFWQRMSKIGGSKPPELLSTHPSDETRIKDIEAFMPQAMKYYKGK